MSEQKTEKPTPKKIRDSRKKGQVAKSRDLTQAVLFLVFLGVLSLGGPAFIGQAESLLRDSFQPALLTGQLGNDEILRNLEHAATRFLLLCAPFLGAVFLAAIAVEMVQVRPLLAAEAIKFKPEKLNVIKGLQNIFFKPRTYL